MNAPHGNYKYRRKLRATFLGLGVNALLAGGKLAAGILGHSHALVADAVESMADLFSSMVVWRGLVVAAEPADERHPYGHGKAEPVAAAIVAAMLLAAALGIAVQGIGAFLIPHPGPAPFTLIVLAGVVAIKEILFRKVSKTAALANSPAVRGDAWHHRSDAITSLAAFLGISVSLLGGPGFEKADDAAAVLAALVIGWNGFSLLRSNLDELMDAQPSPAFIDRIREAAGAVPGVHAVEKCTVRKMGGQYLVDMHVEVNPNLTVSDAHAIAHLVKDRVRLRVPSVQDVLVHIEPGSPEP